MTSRRIDSFLLGLGALLILISSYQLFFKSTQSEDGLTLGTLTSTLSVVKTKSALALDWKDAISGNQLSHNQLIYTDNSSSAAVKFNDGSSLEVGENSLIKLRAGVNEETLDLERGFIRAKLDKPMKVQMNGEDYIVSGQGADVQISLQNEKGEIGVLSGEIQIEGKDLNEKLTSTSALSIDGNTFKKKTIYFKNTSPQKSQLKYGLNLPMRVSFRWEPMEVAKVSIAQNPAMDEADSFEGESGLTTDLAEGLYYYRVENEKGSSLIQSFRVVQERAPELLRPLAGEEIEVIQSKQSSIYVQWKDDSRLSYSLEWFDGEAHSKIVNGSGASLDVKHSGILKWRLRIQDEKRPHAVWTNWQEIKIRLISNPEIPTDLSPHEVEYLTYETPQEKIELQWKTSLDVELEVVSPKGDTVSERVTGSLYEYVATMGGAYRWRVRAVDTYMRASEWTEWKSFVVEDLSTTKSQEGIQRIQLKKPDQAVTFAWEATPGTVSVFELAKDAQFKNIIKKVEASKSSTQISIPEVGTYYWRSREYLSNGTIQVGEPKRVIIEPVPAPDKPAKLPDLEVPLEEMPGKTSSIQSVLNWIIPSAYADELRGMAHITLPTKEEAKGYVVRIYRDEALTDLAFEKNLTDKNFIWKDALPGTYYWQYAVIDFWNRRSLFSDPAILTIKGELVAPPVKPKLLSPIRATEIENEGIELKWTDAESNSRYIAEISDDEEFKNIIKRQETRTPSLPVDLKLLPKMYYWRITALDKKKREVQSNTGRFVVKPPLEKIVVVDQIVWKKNWKNRWMVFWSPSLDTYSFKDKGEKGEIDGQTLMGLGASGTFFFERGALNGEILRQSGEVYEKQEYLFQRALVDYVYTFDRGPNHKWGVGVIAGQTSGQSYGISNGVQAKSESGLSYGAIFRDYLSFNERWEMQSKLLYLAGDVTQIEAGIDGLYHQRNYFWMSGLNYSMRSYSTNSGQQNSFRISLGIGREF